MLIPVIPLGNPHLSLRTTYKKRCLAGLAHPRPGSQHACHKPARGAFSKYCSDECGVRHVRERIEWYAKDTARSSSTGPSRGGRSDSKELKEEGELRGLWESVKGAGRREAVVLRVLDDKEVVEEQKTESEATRKESDPHHPTIRTEVVIPRVSHHARLLARLEAQIDKISARRDELKAGDDIVAWREAVINYAAQRADRRGNCGWDARLLWSDEETRDFGADVVDAYERVEVKIEREERGEDGMAVDGVEDASDEGEWWCTGKKKCDRHFGYVRSPYCPQCYSSLVDSVGRNCVRPRSTVKGILLRRS